MKTIRHFILFLMLALFAGQTLAAPVDINSADAEAIAASLQARQA